MDKIDFLLLIGWSVWLIGIMAGQDQNSLTVEMEPSAVELIVGLAVATVSCQIFLGRSSAR